MHYNNAPHNYSKDGPKLWVTADQHFGHTKLADLRGFSSAEEMDEELIKRHNSKVKTNDYVFILGDFTMRTQRTYVHELTQQLNGRLFFMAGNHDEWLDSSLSKEVKCLPLVLEYKYDGDLVTMCHYPLASWNKSYLPGSFMLHGHCHGKLEDVNPKRLDVGADCHKLAPVELSEILNKLKPNETR